MTQPNLFNPLTILKSLMLTFGGAVGGWIAYSSLVIDHDVPMPPAMDAPRQGFHGKNSCFLSYYADTKAPGRPLVLLHSINAGGSSYEMKPIFEHYAGKRPVYSLDLPGFGFSERTDREYSPDLYIRAILDFLRDEVNDVADVVTFSLTSEFTASAALQEPGFFRSLTLISPTGFTPRQQKRSSQTAAENDTTDTLYGIFSNPLWSQAFYDLLVIRPSLRLFLQRNFVGDVNEGMVDYGYRTTHQPGARYAPLYFLSGKLFSTTVFTEVYQKLRVPAMVLYDKDPNITFDKLPELLASNDSWRARRIPNTLGLPHFEKMDEVAANLNTFWDDM